MADDFATSWMANRARKPWQGPPLPGATGELTAAQPSWRDNLAHLMAMGAHAISGKDYSEAKRDSTTLMGLAPGTGTAMAAQDASKAFGEGDYLGAGINAVGAVPDVGPVGKAIFVGLASRLADKEALKTAQGMLAKGARREDAFRDTGWFQQHGDWKSEISDQPAKLAPNAGFADEGFEPLPEVMRHPKAYEAHPSLLDLNAYAVQGPDAGSFGSYTPPAPAWELGPAKDAEILAGAPNEEELRSIMLHEMQHGVQNLEGFPHGGNPGDKSLMAEVGDVKPRAQALYDQLDQERVGWVRGKMGLGHNDFVTGDQALQFRKLDAEWRALNPDKAKLIDRSFDTLYSGGGPGRGYHHLAGEVEARNVMTRRDMSAAERRATPPWQTQDVPDELQIVRRRGRLAEAMATRRSSQTGQPGLASPIVPDVKKFSAGKQPYVGPVERQSPNSVQSSKYDPSAVELTKGLEFSALDFDRLPTTSVQLAPLVSAQPDVNPQKVERLAKEFDLKGMPPIYVLNIGGRNVIWAGNHRIAAAELGGVKELPAKVLTVGR